MEVVRDEKKAVVVRAPMPMGERGFNFNFETAWRFAKGLIDGGMVPKGITSPGAVVGLIEAGKELGLAPMYALANLTFTNGRLGIMGDAAKALIRKAGALEPGTDFEEVYSGEEYTPEWTCTVFAQRKGQPKPFARSFKMAKAITAGLVRLEGKKAKSKTRDGWGDTGPWATYTERMLMYRALGFLARDYFSDVLGGAVLQEELRDYPTETPQDFTPPAEPDPILSNAVVAEPIEPEPERKPAEEAEVVPPEQPKPTDAPPPDEAAQIKGIERLEGDIVSADTINALKTTWMSARPFVELLPEPERARLTRLYEQNKSGFKGAK